MPVEAIQLLYVHVYCVMDVCGFNTAAPTSGQTGFLKIFFLVFALFPNKHLNILTINVSLYPYRTRKMILTVNFLSIGRPIRIFTAVLYFCHSLQEV